LSENKQKYKDKRQSRIIALQIIYAYEMSNQEPNDIIKFINTHYNEEIIKNSDDAHMFNSIPIGLDMDEEIILVKNKDKPGLEDGIQSVSKSMKDYALGLVEMTVKNSKKIDQYIIERALNWDFNRIALMDKLVLRLFITEMFYISDVPPKVSITEGVEIAKKFSTSDSGSFVNGILDSIYNDLQKGKLDL
tara:strand:+ start:35 stop:607 length:573 start_codon:yes stop_codon:yes gene_type:complete